MEILTARCLIRNFTMEDAEELYQVLSDAKVMLHVEAAYDMEQTKALIQTAGLCAYPLIYALVWKQTGSVIGQIIFHPYETSDYEIGWIVNRNDWGLLTK